MGARPLASSLLPKVKIYKAPAELYKDLSSRSGRKHCEQRFIKFTRYYVNFIKFELSTELYKVQGRRAELLKFGVDSRPKAMNRDL